MANICSYELKWKLEKGVKQRFWLWVLQGNIDNQKYRALLV